MERVLKNNSSRSSVNSRRVVQKELAPNPAQGGIASRINGSPYMVAQRKTLQRLFGEAAQLQKASASDKPVVQRRLVPVENEPDVFRDDRDTSITPQLKFKSTGELDTYTELVTGKTFIHLHFEDQFKLKGDGSPTFLDPVSHQMMEYDGLRFYRCGEQWYTYQKRKYQEFDPNTTYRHSDTGLDYSYDMKSRFYYAYDTSGYSYSYRYDPHSQVCTHFYLGDDGWCEFIPNKVPQTNITIETDFISETNSPPESGITLKTNTDRKPKRKYNENKKDEQPVKKRRLNTLQQNLKPVGNVLNESGGYHIISEDPNEPERYVIRRRREGDVDPATQIDQGLQNLESLRRKLGEELDNTQQAGVIRVPDVSKYDDESYRVERINNTVDPRKLWSTYTWRRGGWESARNKLYAIRAICAKNLLAFNSGDVEPFPDFRPSNVGEDEGGLIYIDFDQTGIVQTEEKMWAHMEQWAGKRYLMDTGGEQWVIKELYEFLLTGIDKYKDQGKTE